MIVTALCGGVATPVAQAQGPAASQPAAPHPIVNAHPTWAELSPAHQQVLAPLQPIWETFPELNRRKWERIAERYPKLKPEEQQRLQERMTEWVKMTPQQRRLARENYQITRTLPPEKKAEAWDRYQQLPEEQKKNLAAAEKVPHRPGTVSALPSGKRPPTDTGRQIHPEKKQPASAPGAVAGPASAAQAAAAAAPAASAPIAPTPAPAAPTAAAPAPPASAVPPSLSPPVTGEAATDFNATDSQRP
jgi:hypothetical protein